MYMCTCAFQKDIETEKKRQMAANMWYMAKHGSSSLMILITEVKEGMLVAMSAIITLRTVMITLKSKKKFSTCKNR